MNRMTVPPDSKLSTHDSRGAPRRRAPGGTRAPPHRPRRRRRQEGAAPLPTAVVAGNDGRAVGIVHALRRFGLTVPGDISVGGFCGSRPSQLPHIDLTTVRQDISGTAEAAVKSPIERFDDGRTEAKHVIRKTDLIVPGTTVLPKR